MIGIAPGISILLSKKQFSALVCQCLNGKTFFREIRSVIGLLHFAFRVTVPLRFWDWERQRQKKMLWVQGLCSASDLFSRKPTC